MIEHKHRPTSAGWMRASAFTLIEMIAVLAILAVVVVLLVSLFTYSDDAVRNSTGRAVNRMAASAAINMLTRDIGNAVTDPSNLVFRIQEGNPDEVSYNAINSNLRFAFLGDSTVETNRDVSLVSYSVRSATNASYQSYELVRSISPVAPAAPAGDPSNPYWEDDWIDATETNNAETLLENVAAFFVAAPGDASEYDSRNNGDRLPEYVDVYIEVLDEPDARIIDNMTTGGAGSSNIYDFVNYRVRRYSTRVHFNNRYGQKKR